MEGTVPGSAVAASHVQGHLAGLLTLDKSLPPASDRIGESCGRVWPIEHTDEVDIDAARELARTCHAGQVDKVGRDYFDAHLTPIGEAAAIFGDQVAQAAWLHDVVEDTSTSLADLLAIGFDPDVVAAVDAVSRRHDETYAELIDRASAHPVGRLVKLVDNAWNVAANPGLASVDPALAQSMLHDRYLPARRRLLAAAGLAEESQEILEVQQILDQHLVRLAKGTT